MLAKLNSNKIRHSNEHEIWLFTSATILCSARFAVVNICLEQQNCQENASSAETVLSHASGVHVPAAALSHQAHGCRWLLKNYDTVLRSYTDRKDTQGSQEQIASSSGLNIHFWFLCDSSTITISPSPDRPCAVTEEYHPPEDLGCRRSVVPGSLYIQALFYNLFTRLKHP